MRLGGSVSWLNNARITSQTVHEIGVTSSHVSQAQYG
jgi:hypothetical protein